MSNGPEPQPDDFPVDGLEDVPRFQAPAMKAMPQWSPAPLKTPSWCPPCEPRPIGFMRGTAPVLIIDVSGTMNPRQRGKFPDMKECVCELLHPQGERMGWCWAMEGGQLVLSMGEVASLVWIGSMTIRCCLQLWPHPTPP